MVRITSYSKRFAYDIINMSADYDTQLEKRSDKKSPSADKLTIAQHKPSVNTKNSADVQNSLRDNRPNREIKKQLENGTYDYNGSMKIVADMKPITAISSTEFTKGEKVCFIKLQNIMKALGTKQIIKYLGM